MSQSFIRLIPQNETWDVRNPPQAEWISNACTDWATWVRDHRSQPSEQPNAALGGVESGTVEFNYPTGGKGAEIHIIKRYNPQHIPTMAHILGCRS